MLERGLLHFKNTVKPLNSGHLWVIKNLSVTERCPLLGGNLKKIVTFVTQHFVRYSWYVRYLGCLLLGDFTVFILCYSFANRFSEIPVYRFA